MGQVQHYARTAGPHGMAQSDGPAIHIHLGRVDGADGGVQAQHGLAELRIGQGLGAGQHLGGEGFVQFPQGDVGQGQLVLFHQGGGRQGRTQAHDARIKARPGAIDNARQGRELVLFHSGLGGQDHPAGAVGDLR